MIKPVRLNVGLMCTSMYNSTLRKIIVILFGVGIFFASSGSVFAVNNLLFDTATKNVNMGETLQVPVNIHTDADVKVIGADVWVTYDPVFLDVQSINEGSFFPSITGQKSSAGKVYLAGMLEDTTTTKSGDGTIATVIFTVKQTGQTKVQYDCRGNTVSDTSKININFSNPQNVIDCASTVTNIMTVNIGNPSTEVPVTPTPTIVGSTGGTGGTNPAVTSPPAYVPGGSALSPTPSTLPQSGFFDSTLYYVISGGFLVSVGGILKKLYGRPY